MSRRTIELSHPIRHGLITYPGLPGPEISDHLSRADAVDNYAEGTTFQIGRITMVSNTGTYLDTPFHRYDGGDDLAQVGLERLADLEGLALDVRGRAERALGPELIHGLDVSGHAVLFATGWDRHWETDAYAVEAPFVTAALADALADGGATLVGIDSINIDDISVDSGGERPVHTRLLGAGIPIVEHLRNLAALPAWGFRFHAAPPLVAGMGTFPVRAYAVVDQT
jgi:kynurenine formamidase